MVSSTIDTLLVLQGMGLPHYSARGVTQTLVPIAASIDQRRTINGVLSNLANTQFRKFTSKITCTDQQPPAIDGIWPGMILTVDCVYELCYPVGGSNERPEVSGSSRTVDGFVFYRPVLTMMVTNFNSQIDEWKSDVQWELDLEEV